jgi:ribonuclease G
MIDVDSGGAPALATNLAAAREAARQIRLRNLAGPIVIDFIGLKKRTDRERVTEALAAALAEDPGKPELLGWTRLGHVELVRPRRQAPLAEILFAPAQGGGLVKTALTLALEALRALARAIDYVPGQTPVLAVHPEIATALEAGEGRAARAELEARLGRKIAVVAEPNRGRDFVDIRPQ